MNLDFAFQALGWLVIGAPALAVMFLGLSAILDRNPGERTVNRAVQTAVLTGLVCSLAILGMMLVTGKRHINVTLGDWVLIDEYHFLIKFLFDRLSVPFAILTFVLCGTISAFASRYMHRERGFLRFYVLFSIFMLGMIITSLAGAIETLFAGWEFVGLASAMLVAFFHERPAPPQNGLHVWIVYRFSDAALLLASILIHHWAGGSGDFDAFLGSDSWPDGKAPIVGWQAFAIGSLLLIAAAGKSALVPFSGWLPRAMEGPTPSSAVFYGALSVHLGAFLLLRAGPIIDQSPILRVVIVLLGISTAIFAAITARVQSDIKSALSFASLTQVGIIVVEVGLGFSWLRYVALVHIIGHGFLRTLQFLRAPTLLQDYRSLENAIGAGLPPPRDDWEKRFSFNFRSWLYRTALDRGHLDAFLRTWIVDPVLSTFAQCERWERRWTMLLGGPEKPPSESRAHLTYEDF